MGDSFDVIMAAYQATDLAERDFDALAELVKARSVRSEGLILVEHHADGQVQVTQTGDHCPRSPGSAMPGARTSSAAWCRASTAVPAPSRPN